MSPAATPVTATPSATPVAAPSPAPTVAELLARIDEAKLREHVAKLASFGSRHPAHAGHAEAIAYLESELRRAGAQYVARQPGGAVRAPVNVAAFFGPEAKSLVADVVVGAHYDTIADRSPGWRADRDPAPGANDNGTGVAALLEIARVLAAESRAERLRRTVALVFFDEEELGMKGSRTWVEANPHRGRIVINLDMVGFSGPGRKKLDLMRYPSSGDLPERVKAANERYRLGLQLVDRLFPAEISIWVDSTPFAIAGIPAVTLTESYGQPGIDYPGYPGFHRVTDTPEQISNVAQWRAAAQLVLAVVLELAR